MAAGPSILSQLTSTPVDVANALKSRMAGGQASAPLSAGPGSAMSQNSQVGQVPQQPLAPAHIEDPRGVSSNDFAHQGPYGSRPGEKRIDVSEYQKGLSGLSDVKKK